MSSLDSISSAAAANVGQTYALLSAQIGGVGLDPTAGGITSMNQTDVASQAAIDTLKLSLNAEASMGTQLAQMIGQGSGVDITA